MDGGSAGVNSGVGIMAGPGPAGPQGSQPPAVPGQQPVAQPAGPVATGPLGASAPPQPLPPQMFTTSAQLLDLTDKKLLVSLRDGRKLIGVLRSWDQYANLVLQGTVERLFVDNIYCDVPRGVFIVRGENVLLLGEIDLDKEDELPFKEAPLDQVFALMKQKQAENKRKDKVKRKKLQAMGFEEDEQHTSM